MCLGTLLGFELGFEPFEGLGPARHAIGHAPKVGGGEVGDRGG